MCIKLANISYEIPNLTPIQKHILLILCNRSNPKSKIFWCSIPNIIKVSGYSINTIEKTMKFFRDNDFISYTGDFKGTRKTIPSYFNNISNHPTRRGDLSLTTPRQKDTTPPEGGINHPTGRGTERSSKEYKKESFFSLEKLTDEEQADRIHYLKHPKIKLSDATKLKLGLN